MTLTLIRPTALRHESWTSCISASGRLVGWAKAHLRRAHHSASEKDAGHASLCPPYPTWPGDDAQNARAATHDAVKIAQRIAPPAVWDGGIRCANPTCGSLHSHQRK